MSRYPIGYDSENSDLLFVRGFLQSRHDLLETLDHLTDADLQYTETSDDEHRCSEIARVEINSPEGGELLEISARR